ncbi:MAG: lipopolysaccharide transport periplasmic protein LptA [Betaproteobacteria bacterium]|nr:lipopolysaccharide transport periplasmic protein LptA [Betaproteobacteria bacterium]
MRRPSICRHSAVNKTVICIALGAWLQATQLAWAEKSDREKPVHIDADKMMLDDAKKESVFEGNVVLTQGTLEIKGDRVIVRQDAQGFQYGIAYGNPATFRQKREGHDEYIEGFADRLEYDGKKDLLQMFNAARLTKGHDEVVGDYISYNAKTEFFKVTGGGKTAPSGSPENGRVHAVIQPRGRDDTGTKQRPAGTSLKPSTSLER